MKEGDVNVLVIYGFGEGVYLEVKSLIDDKSIKKVKM